MQISCEHIYLFRHAAHDIFPKEIIDVILAQMCHTSRADYHHAISLSKTQIINNLVFAGIGTLWQDFEILRDTYTSDLTTSLFHLAQEKWSEMIESDNNTDDSIGLWDELIISIRISTENGPFCCAEAIDYGDKVVYLRLISAAELRQLAGEVVWKFRHRNTLLTAIIGEDDTG